MYKVELDKTVDKFLSKHKGQPIIKQFMDAVEKLKENPFTNSLSIGALEGHKGKYKLRLSKYRFIYEVLEEEILIYIFDVGSRGNIYKDY